MQKETIESVTQWADETFGKATTEALIRRVWQEMKEFDEATLSFFHAGSEDTVRMAENHLAREAADVCICLYRILGYLNPQAIDAKMFVNRMRKWKSNGDGTGQHIKGV